MDPSPPSPSTPSTSDASPGFSALEAGPAFLPFTAGIVIGAGLSQELVPALGAREIPQPITLIASSGIPTDGVGLASDFLSRAG